MGKNKSKKSKALRMSFGFSQTHVFEAIDKFIQHREVLRQGDVVQVDMSYLVRKKKASS